MRRSGRLLALGLLALAFLAANGFAGVVAYTLIAGERVEAEIVSCSMGGGKSSTTCRGRWTGADGHEHTDTVTGAGSADLHQRLAVRTGPAGTYTDTLGHLWVRSIFAVGVDAGLVIVVFLWLRIRRRGPEAVARLTAVASAPVFEVGSNLIRRHRGTDVFTVEDVDRRRMRLVDPAGIERWLIRGEDHPRASVLVVTDAAGTPVGSVRQDSATAAVDILDADGEHLVRVTYGPVYRVPGVRYVDPSGDQPAVAVSSRGAMVVRFDPEAPEALRLLVFAQLQGAGWLSMSRFRRKAKPSA